MTVDTGDFTIDTASAVETQTIFNEECHQEDRCITLDPAVAQAGGTIEWVFSSPTTSSINFQIDVSADVSLDVWDVITCGTGQAIPETMIAGMNGTVIVTALNSSGGVLGSWNDSGAIQTSDGATVDQFGLFDTAQFAKNSSGNLITVSGTATLSYSIPVGTKTLSLTLSSFGRGTVGGDLDGDGRVCWAARDAMRTAWGAALGDSNYNRRVDLDFDGDIDSADLSALNATPCSADFNCDGVIDTFDNQGFLNAYSSQDDTADVNYDGVWDFYDVQMFLNAYSVGCS